MALLKKITMDFLHALTLKLEPMQFLYGAVAIIGGVARYLNSFTTGTPFNFGIFLASVFVSGFSGYMFSLVGLSMGLPQAFIFIMAGMGGFMGDQTMKLVAEYVQTKTKTKAA